MPSVVHIDTPKKIKSASRGTCEMLLRKSLILGANEIGGVKFDWPYNLARTKGRFEIFHVNKATKTAEAIEEDDLYKAVVEVTEKVGRKIENFIMSNSQVKGFIEKLRLTCESIDLKPFGFKSDPSYVETRASFDPIPGYQAKDLIHFKEFLDRITNMDAFMAFIGSLFDPDCKHEQYVWIYGDGRNGKSKIFDTIGAVLGKAMGSVSAPDSDHPGQFWTYNFYTKHLVLMREAENAKFINSGTFKSLVTRESVQVEKKYRDPKEIIIPARYIILGNKRPDIDPNEASGERLIYCEVAKPQKKDPFFKDRLMTEVDKFISACITTYEEKYQNGSILVDEKVKEKFLEDSKEHEIGVFHSLFQYHEGHTLEAGDVYRVLFEKYKLNNYSYSRLINTWIKLAKIEKDNVRIKGVKTKIYRHINWRFRPDIDQRVYEIEKNGTDIGTDGTDNRTDEKINNISSVTDGTDLLL